MQKANSPDEWWVLLLAGEVILGYDFHHITDLAVQGQTDPF
jgi:hypothetical protein